MSLFATHSLLFCTLLTLFVWMHVGHALSSTDRRIALVTGANKGIGKEIVQKLIVAGDENAPQQWTVFLGSRDATRGQAAVKELQKVAAPGNQVICCPLDVTDSESIQSAFDQIQQQCGRLDVLINNAALCFNDPTLHGRVPYTPFEQQAQSTIDTNFVGTLRVTQAMMPLLLQQQGNDNDKARIINIASAAGRLAILKNAPKVVEKVASPNLQINELELVLQTFVQDVQAGCHASKGWPNTCYGMSKVGIIALTRIWAREYPTTIHVSSVDPGYCATDQNNHQGILEAAQGAVTPYWLATTDLREIPSGRHWYQQREIAW